MLFANLADYVTTIYALENGFKRSKSLSRSGTIQTNSFTFVKLVSTYINNNIFNPQGKE